MDWCPGYDILGCDVTWFDIETSKNNIGFTSAESKENPLIRFNIILQLNLSVTSPVSLRLPKIKFYVYISFSPRACPKVAVTTILRS